MTDNAPALDLRSYEAIMLAATLVAAARDDEDCNKRVAICMATDLDYELVVRTLIGLSDMVVKGYTRALDTGTSLSDYLLDLTMVAKRCKV